MAWTSPTTRTTGTLITASIWNTDVVDNLTYLYSQVNEQIQISGGAWLPTETSGASSTSFETTTNKNNFRVCDFSNSGGLLYAQFAHELPSDYDGGTVTYHVHWTAASASTNGVVFGLAAASYANDDTLDAAFGTAVEVTDANLASGDVNVSDESGAVTIAGSPAAGDLVLWQLYRDSGDASDTLAATVRVLNVVITYTRA